MSTCLCPVLRAQRTPGSGLATASPTLCTSVPPTPQTCPHLHTTPLPPHSSTPALTLSRHALTLLLCNITGPAHFPGQAGGPGDCSAAVCVCGAGDRGDPATGCVQELWAAGGCGSVLVSFCCSCAVSWLVTAIQAAHDQNRCLLLHVCLNSTVSAADAC